jgi:hypothetical protein
MNKFMLNLSLGCAIAATLFASRPVHAGENAFEAVHDGVEAYIYGYPLITMEMTRRVMTNVREPEGTRAPMGQFVRALTYPDASFRDVTAPNADTLYTTAWIDVSKEPWILSLPDANDRYYLFPMLDGWTDVFQVPGKRTTGPGWKGTLPDGVVEYKSPTSIVWLLGRIYCTGTPEDYDAVHKLQDEISVVPLSSYGKPYTPPPAEVDASTDMKTAVREQVNKLSMDDYFNLLAKLMQDNPPNAADKPMLKKMAKLGIVPGQPFDGSKLRPAAREAFSEVPSIANEKIMLYLKESIITGDMKLEHGWAFSPKLGVYGTNYILRALVTAIGLGANRGQDAIYPTSEGPNVLESYNGAHKYVMHFDKGQLPPAQGFWSVTMYDANYFFVDNPLNRYSISARQNLKANADGSVDLYIQHDSPGADKESNWLPAPADKFILMMRLYWPSEKDPSILDGSWVIPAAQKVN